MLSKYDFWCILYNMNSTDDSAIRKVSFVYTNLKIRVWHIWNKKKMMRLCLTLKVRFNIHDVIYTSSKYQLSNPYQYQLIVVCITSIIISKTNLLITLFWIILVMDINFANVVTYTNRPYICLSYTLFNGVCHIGYLRQQCLLHFLYV